MEVKEKLVPKLFISLRSYSKNEFSSDLISGITVGLVALPLAMAFGIASGVTPQAGIYTAVIAGFLISALGGSRLQIGGPTGAFVVIVSGIIAKFGVAGLTIVTLMAGLILLVMGITGLGSAVKFIPRPVTIGFTNGIALLIISTQIKDFFGLTTPSLPGDFNDRLKILIENFHTVNLSTLLLSITALALILVVPRFNSKIPGSIVALLVATLISAFSGLHFETIGLKFGGIPTGLPDFNWPDLTSTPIIPLIPAAFTVAILAALESLLSAVVADGMSGDKHNSNMELIAQGFANIASPLFGGIPATGAIARTATNIRSGAQSPVSGIIHALTLLFILLIAAPLAQYIPLAALAAVLFVVAYNMGEWKEISSIVRLSSADVAVWAVTFLLTVFADLTIAVEVGMLLAALFYIHRVAQTTSVNIITEDHVNMGRRDILQDKQIPAYVTLIRIHGPFLFGTTDKLSEETSDLNRLGDVVILRLRNMTAIDATGLHAIEVLAKRLEKCGKALLICNMPHQPNKLLHQSKFVKHIGTNNIFPHFEAALKRAEEIKGAFGGVGMEIASDYTKHPVT
jgi:SulP family sulfate permease